MAFSHQSTRQDWILVHGIIVLFVSNTFLQGTLESVHFWQSILGNVSSVVFKLYIPEDLYTPFTQISEKNTFPKWTVHPKMKICWSCTRPQAIQDVDEFASSWEQIWRNLHYFTYSPMDPLPSECPWNSPSPVVFHIKIYPHIGLELFLLCRFLCWFRPDCFFTGGSNIMDYGLTF